MGSNSFGQIFKITTYGESHGPKIGVIIDGCPPNLKIDEDEIDEELKKRKSFSIFSTPRKEKDRAKIISGVFKHRTTGAPICIEIENSEQDSDPYDAIEDLYRPSHANFTYLEKYGVFDHRGASRASARETAARVAAGAIAKKLLKENDIELLGFIKSLGKIDANLDQLSFSQIKKKKEKSLLLCPDSKACKKMLAHLKKIEGDSVGAIVQLISTDLLVGLGDPIYEKLSCNLAKAMLSIPGCTGFEIGSGFSAARKLGSENNDLFIYDDFKKKIVTKTNNCGGILAGISTSMPLDIKVAFKPTSTIQKPQETLNTKKERKTLIYKNFRSDMCIGIRAVAVVEAMAALVLIDSLLLQKINRRN